MTEGKTHSTLITLAKVINLYLQWNDQNNIKYHKGELSLLQGFCCCRYQTPLLKTENMQLQKIQGLTCLRIMCYKFSIYLT